MSDGMYAVISAIWPTYDLEDLGVNLIRGHSITKEKTEADKSKDLGEAVNLNAVHVEYVKKCQNIRPNSHLAPPTNRRLKKPPRPTVHPPKPVTVVRETVREVPVIQQVVQQAPALDEDALLRKMAVVFGGVMDQRLKEQEKILRAEFRSSQATVINPDLGELRDSLTDMLRGVVGEVQTPVQETLRQPDTPLFIPSRILSGKTTDTIQVQKTTSDSAGVDDAAAKLKALRKRRKDSGMV